MARAVANLNGAQFFEATPETFKTPETAMQLFNNLSIEGHEMTGEVVGKIKPAVIFIDEAHNLPIKAQEILGMAMENFTHTYLMGHGKQKQNITVWLPQFTVVCATTNSGKLSKMFRDRFKLNYVFKAYSNEEACQVIQLHAKRLNLKITGEAVEDIAKRSRGTPRIMVRYLERAADSAEVAGEPCITEIVSGYMFKMMGVDDTGLLAQEIELLKCLYTNQGEPVGLDNLAIILGESGKTIADVYEPFLISRHFVLRTSRGRILTERGLEYLVSKGHVSPAEKMTNMLDSQRIIARQ